MSSRPFIAAVFVLTLAVRASSQEAPKEAATPSRAELIEMSKPGAEHEGLAALAGDWQLDVGLGAGDRRISALGSATCRMRVGGRFLQIEYQAGTGAAEQAGMFHIGFDRRHGHYALVSMDTYGTYFVTSAGKRDAETGRIKMFGKDDDPVMKAMGWEKEFIHVLDLRGPDAFSIEVWFIDTRTPARHEIKSMDFVFSRAM